MSHVEMPAMREKARLLKILTNMYFTRTQSFETQIFYVNTAGLVEFHLCQAWLDSVLKLL